MSPQDSTQTAQSHHALPSPPQPPSSLTHHTQHTQHININHQNHHQTQHAHVPSPLPPVMEYADDNSNPSNININMNMNTVTTTPTPCTVTSKYHHTTSSSRSSPPQATHHIHSAPTTIPSITLPSSSSSSASNTNSNVNSLNVIPTGSVPNPMSAFVSSQTNSSSSGSSSSSHTKGMSHEMNPTTTGATYNMNPTNNNGGTTMTNNSFHGNDTTNVDTQGTTNVNLTAHSNTNVINSNNVNSNSNANTNANGPKFATSGGIRHNVFYNYKPPSVTPSDSVPATSSAPQGQQQGQQHSSPMDIVVSDTCSISTHQTHGSNTSNSSQVSNPNSGNSSNNNNTNTNGVAATTSTTYLPNKSAKVSSNPMTKPRNSILGTSSNPLLSTSMKTYNNNTSTSPMSTKTHNQIIHNNVNNINNNNNNNIKTITNTNNTNVTVERRQKRLERNRESARLSRRRRKQYLEILEDRVNFLSNELDQSRRNHVLSSTKVVDQLRMELLHVQQQAQVQAQAQVHNTEAGDNLHVQRQQQQQQDLIKNMSRLSNQLNRMSDELKLCITFGKEYGKSMIVPTTSKFMLWLTLQNDVYYRGGRAASERLSAARIGERMLSCGHNRVSPSNGMWPLFCNEIGLSYDQEERVRTFQKEIISRHDTWLYRHVSYSAQHIVQSLHDAIIASCELVKRREQRVMDVLTEEQKMKFLIWKMNKTKLKKDVLNNEGKEGVESIANEKVGGVGEGSTSCSGSGESSLLDRLTQSLMQKLNLGNDGSNEGGSGLKDSSANSSTFESESVPMETDISTSTPSVPSSSATDSFEISPNQHDAANLYILNHKLLSVTQTSLPTFIPVSTNPLVLKRLSRRPSFESLAAVTESENGGGGKKERKKQNNMMHASSSRSLKRCSSEMSCDESGMMNMMMKKSNSGISLSSSSANIVTMTPEAAQMASSHVVSATLGHIRSLIPPMNTAAPIMTKPTTMEVCSIPNVNNPGDPYAQQGVNTGTINNNANTSAIYQQNQQQQQVPLSTQPMYQPSSTIVPLQAGMGGMTAASQQNQQYDLSSQQHVQQTTYLPISNTIPVYSQQQVTVPDGTTFSYDSHMNADVVPNTIQSSEIPPQIRSTNNNTVSVEPFTTYSTSSYGHIDTQPQQDITNMNHRTYHTDLKNNIQLPLSNSVSASVISTKSSVPSPLGLADQTNYQYQQQQTNTNMDMIVDDSLLQPFDVGGSFYNVSSQAADDSLFELTEEDWAIGEGAFLDS